MLIVRLFAYILLIASASSAELKLSTFLEAHCYDCHDDEKQKGGLDLTALKTDFAAAENFARWVKVHDRIESGEMPPKKKARPPAAEKAAALKWLRDSLIAAERTNLAPRLAGR